MILDEKARLQYLVRTLLAEHPGKTVPSLPDSVEELRYLLRCLMNIRPDIPISDEWLTIQDQELDIQKREKGIIGIDQLRPSDSYPNIYLWQGDITRLEVDAIVNAANSKLLGCFVPGHHCIDNAIHSAAGVQLRAACGRIMKEQGCDERTGKAKITEAYNLPSKYVIHTVGPIVDGDSPTEEDCCLLASCYKECLSLAADYHLESIAFCCISTGVFRFPNHRAAEIAIQTVRDFMGDAKESHRPKIVFNVFKDEDYAIYQELLRC